MNNTNALAEALRSQFEPIEPMDFYRDIFPLGELAPWEDNPAEDCSSASNGYKYVGVAVEVTQQKKKNGDCLVKRHSICNELDTIDLLLHSENFVLLSPISYVGKTRRSSNARFMYALCVEIDNLVEKNGRQSGLKNLIVQWTSEYAYIPQPTYIVASGSGLHLYYLFDKPLALFPNVVDTLKVYKKELTRKLWNQKVTTSYKESEIQYESLFQGFRLAGGKTKKGGRTEVFRTGERVTVEYMNKFVRSNMQIDEAYRSDFSLDDARIKFPEWYERKIVQGIKTRKKWDIAGKVHGNNPYALYDWWLDRINYEGKVGHRYHCLLMLVIYAIKCDVPQERLEQDCFELLKIYESLTDDEDNHFTEKDVLDALQAYEDKDLMTYPISSIVYKSGIEIKKNKRNGRKQDIHLARVRALQDFDDPNGEWRNKDGRPSVEHIVKEWRKSNPNGRKADCIKETGLSKPTVYKWWDN